MDGKIILNVKNGYSLLNIYILGSRNIRAWPLRRTPLFDSLSDLTGTKGEFYDKDLFGPVTSMSQ
jgi:hypothetical protein